MGLKEISLAQLLNNTSGTDYFSMFAKLIGHSEDSVFYEGIGDEELDFLELLETNLKYQLPSNYLEFLSYLNGGKFLGVTLFSLTDKDYPDSLIARNFLSKIRKDFNVENNFLIIGKFDNYIIYVDCEDDGSYTLMDIKNNEKIEFQSLGALIGFIFYIFMLKENEKIEKEKAQILEIKENLHNHFKKRNKEIKKEREKNNAKLRAKVAAKALKEEMRKKRSKR